MGQEEDEGENSIHIPEKTAALNVTWSKMTPRNRERGAEKDSKVRPSNFECCTRRLFAYLQLHFPFTKVESDIFTSSKWAFS
jgi:hypothetical protein